eukprot:TRINITY_DN1166_c0_g1_i3.p1 TRINITY_DN1166_c0_g1~~TRINITY_DN1166_c0_g1_i3.p1  ORF type:complete len:195 (-),score=67.12 TRINITY_DN1166_c0_g1_i3:24-557(-)
MASNMKGPVAQGTDGSDFKYRQHIEAYYEQRAFVKKRIEKMFNIKVLLFFLGFAYVVCGHPQVQLASLPSVTGTTLNNDFAFFISFLLLAVLGRHAAARFPLSTSWLYMYLLFSASFVILSLASIWKSHFSVGRVFSMSDTPLMLCLGLQSFALVLSFGAVHYASSLLRAAPAKRSN